MTSPRLLIGGNSSPHDLYIEPTVIHCGALKDLLSQPPSSAMDSEIFGPILPILTIDSLEEATQYINQR